MNLTSEPINIFVFGDLVLDHFIPLTVKARPYHETPGEQSFDGHPRRTVPGGAANSARLIAALGSGRVCLWGLSGYSPWGSFVQILERSNLSNRPDRSVIYHGSHNESRKMNTVTRLVRIDEDGTRHRLFRVDDLYKIRPTGRQQRDAIEYLRLEVKNKVHAIIFNDFDLETLTKILIKGVGDVATGHNIPVFVDPKGNWKKYASIHVTCALPNLKEWCNIVNDPNGEENWRRDIQERRLEGLAIRCLRYMPNVDCHLIKCDKDGAVLIAPVGGGRRMIRHIKAPTRTRNQQLGPGDILVAALAMEYACQKDELDQSKRMYKALGKALGVTACYLEMNWQEVPSVRDIQQFKAQKLVASSHALVPESVLLLPEDVVDLRKFQVHGSFLVSKNTAYKSKIQDLIDLFSQGWESLKPRSAILTGKGGVGKSDLTGILHRVSEEFGFVVWNGLDCTKARSVGSAINQIQAELGKAPDEARGVLVVIDEAFSAAGHLLHFEKGKMLIQEAEKCRPAVRFLFVDADLSRHRKKLSKSQFLDRCVEFILPPLSERHEDIPYIFAASCLRLLKSRSVKITEAVLLAVINWILNDPDGERNARNIVTEAERVVSTVRKERPAIEDGYVAEVSRRHLPEDLRKHLPDELKQRSSRDMIPDLEEIEVQKHFRHFSW